jgi:hypothetical protein
MGILDMFNQGTAPPQIIVKNKSWVKLEVKSTNTDEVVEKWVQIEIKDRNIVINGKEV